MQFVTAEKDIKLEVLDWGGTGRPMILLSAFGRDAHEWDGFAPKFKATHHLYAISRRGFGSSSKPDPRDGNYSADRQGDDVLAVIDALKLDHLETAHTREGSDQAPGVDADLADSEDRRPGFSTEYQ